MLSFTGWGVSPHDKRFHKQFVFWECSFFWYVYLLIYNKCPFIQGLGLTVHDKKMAQAIGVRLRNLLKLPKAHKWVCYEWFYSNLDMWVAAKSQKCSDFLVHDAILYIITSKTNKKNICGVLFLSCLHTCLLAYYADPYFWWRMTFLSAWRSLSHS